MRSRESSLMLTASTRPNTTFALLIHSYAIAHIFITPPTDSLLAYIHCDSSCMLSLLYVGQPCSVSISISAR